MGTLAMVSQLSSDVCKRGSGIKTLSKRDFENNVRGNLQVFIYVVV